MVKGKERVKKVKLKNVLFLGLPFFTALFLLVVLCPFPAFSHGKEPVQSKSQLEREAGEKGIEKLAGELASVVAALREEREAFLQEKERDQMIEKTLKGEIQRLRARLADLQEQENACREGLEGGSREIRSLNERKERHSSELARLRDFLGERGKEWLRRANQEIPPLRGGRVKAWEAFVERTGSLQESIPSLVQDFWSLLEEELEIGEGKEITEGEVLLDGQQVTGQILRVGKVFCIFQSNDGKKLGILTREWKPQGERYRWINALGFFTRARVRKAFDILERRRPPQFTDLPVHSAWFSGGGAVAPGKKGGDKK